MNKNTSYTHWMMWGTLLIALLAAAGGYSLWRITQSSPQSDYAAMLTLPEPRVVADFSLIDQDAQPFSLQNLQGRWSLMFFGFTHCPDVCPSALYDLQQLSQRVDSEQPAANYQVVFVSVDPERDSPEKLQAYTEYFDPDFIGVTGDHAQLQPLTLQLGIAYRIEEHDAEQTAYNVDHSASIMVINPQGQLHGIFPTHTTMEAMTADFIKLLN